MQHGEPELGAVDPEPTGAAAAQPAVADALGGLDGLDQLSTTEHIARFTALHRALAEALSSIDEV